MADHLERMGRELKCPICLSLFTSAVSLTCNHVFCNACIIKSMKSVSCCPVCKVPYQRREVRPAPHMDNLVNVYKSMELASGISIFVTQNAPSTKLSGEKQVEVDHSCASQETNKASQDRAETEGTFRGKASKRLFKTSVKNSDLNTSKPSFPTKKRVQVPQNPLSETPLRQFEGGQGDNPKGPNNNYPAVGKMPDTNEKKGPELLPFFWLREDEGEEKLSQTSDEDHVVESPLMNAPTFSDIKESDDEMPSNLTGEGKVQSNANIAEYFDSEMFEWTQRACSPELRSSPGKMQVADTEEFDEIQDKESNAVLQGASTCVKNTCTESVNVNGHTKTENSKKRGRKASKKPQRKWTMNDADQVFEIHLAPNKITDSAERQKSNQNGSSPNLEDSTNKMTEKVGSYKSVIRSTPETVPSLSAELRPSNEGIGKVSDLPVAAAKEQGSSENFSVNVTNCGRINRESHKSWPVRSKNSKQNFSVDTLTGNVRTTKSQQNEVPASESVLFFPPTIEIEKVSGSRTSKHARESKSLVNRISDEVLRCSKRLKIPSDKVTENKVDNGSRKDQMEIVDAEETPCLKSGHSHSKDLDHASTTMKAPFRIAKVLRKCNTVNQIQCAFCHSAEDSEASGEMVHYLNGKPVKADCSEGHIIHSHRNCTEWAPNVYFDDEIAVNLESELARSRRIKCSLCGEKGAALGCYEKSCRRSFHFPCVKFVPQIRWDTDNFVMLCPLHASSKLPSEIPRHQQKERKKCILKGQSHSPQAQVAIKQDSASSWCKKSFGSAAKFVLCCSALAVAEREIVSEFERLCKVLVLKKWDSSVTHVIASTDENGACKRTLKVLKGILEGKWILSIEWIKACWNASKPVNEEHYEINVDIHGIKDGPRLGRLRLLNKQPKLFDGLKFYFSGDFVPSYKGYLQDLVIAAGGTVLHRKPISDNKEAVSFECSTSSTFIIYSLEPPEKCDPNNMNLIFNRRRVDAEALSRSSGAKVATNLWVLNSIAACKLQTFAE